MHHSDPKAKTELSIRSFHLYQTVVGLIAATVFFVNLGGVRLWDRDEPRNAGCAAEMMERGDWVVPVFNGELRTHKPVLLYWLIMSAYAVFGVNEFAARFWSAALSVGTVVATCYLGRRLFSPRVGLWAGVVLSTSLMFDVAGRAATPDAALIFFSTMAIVFFVRGALAPDSVGSLPGSWHHFALMYAMMGLAVLAKGPVGFVLPAAVIGLFLLCTRPRPLAAADGEFSPGGVLPVRVAIEGVQEANAPRPERHLRLDVALDRRRWAAWLRPLAPGNLLRIVWGLRPVTALLVLGVVALPWYVWVGVRTDGEFLKGFLLDHNLGRAAQPMEGHSGSLIFYPLAMLVGFFPWSVFAVPVIWEMVAHLRRRDEWHPGYVLAACWVAVYVGVFSLARTKLPNYVTPCYPALALATGAYLFRWIRGPVAASRGWQRAALIGLGLAGVAVMAAAPVASLKSLPGEAWLALLGLAPLGGAVLAWRYAETARPRGAVVVIAAAAVAWAVGVFGWALERVDRHQENHVLLAAIDEVGVRPQVGAFGCLEPSWIFYGGQPITPLAIDAPDDPPSGSRWQPKPIRDVREFFRESEDRVIITTDAHWKTLRGELPPDATVLAECPRFLKRGRLVLVGHVVLQARLETIRE